MKEAQDTIRTNEVRNATKSDIMNQLHEKRENANAHNECQVNNANHKIKIGNPTMK